MSVCFSVCPCNEVSSSISLFSRDTNVGLNNIANAETTDQFKTIHRRTELYKLSKSVRLAGPILSAGICQSGRGLPPLTRVTLKLLLGNEALRVCQVATVTTEFRMVIEEVRIFVKRQGGKGWVLCTYRK